MDCHAVPNQWGPGTQFTHRRVFLPNSTHPSVFTHIRVPIAAIPSHYSWLTLALPSPFAWRNACNRYIRLTLVPGLLSIATLAADLLRSASCLMASALTPPGRRLICAPQHSHLSITTIRAHAGTLPTAPDSGIIVPVPSDGAALVAQLAFAEVLVTITRRCSTRHTRYEWQFLSLGKPSFPACLG